MFEIFYTSASTAALLGFDLEAIIKTVSLIGVAAIVFAESGLLIGFFLPGDSLLFTTGFLVQTGILPFNIYFVMTVLFIAAVTGDSVGYSFGRRVGRKLFESDRRSTRFFKVDHLRQAETFYHRHGGKTIILARFIPVIRTFAPIVAGTAKMRYRHFLAYNLVGALLWAGGITYLGYLLGDLFTNKLGMDIDQVILPAAAIIILISVAPPVLHILRDKKRRDAMTAMTKRQMASFFSKTKR